MHCLRVHVEKTVCVGEGPAEQVQQFAQIGAGLGFRGVRPEEESQMLARLRYIAVQEEVGEERLQAWFINTDYWLLTVD
jgi:hypothetical protein